MNLHDQVMKEKLYRAQRGRCNAPCEDYAQRRGIFLPERLFERDHIDSNGPDGIENRQLLCTNCNRIKGDRGMEFLLERLWMTWEMEQMTRNQLTIFSPEGVVKNRQVVQRSEPQRPQRQHRPKYMGPGLAACIAGVLLFRSWCSIRR